MVERKSLTYGLVIFSLVIAIGGTEQINWFLFKRCFKILTF